MKTLIVLRGLPGSGKSFLANEIMQQNSTALVLSTDHFFQLEPRPYLSPDQKIHGRPFVENLPSFRLISLEDCSKFNLEKSAYVFNHDLLKTAHIWNQKRTRYAMQSGCSLIIIDNTNVKMWEAEPYFKLAREYNYQVIVKEPQTDWWINRDLKRMAQINSHGVSFEKVKLMMSGWEDFT